MNFNIIKQQTIFFYNFYDKLKFILFIILLVSLNFNNYCQINGGAKQISMSGSGTALSNDVFALFNNPAGLAQLNWREVGVFYSPSPFGLKELANGFLSYNEPFSFGSISIGGMTYGFDLYKESKILVGFSHNFSNLFFAGVVINYHSVSISKYGNQSKFYLNVGGLAYITNNLRWGFYIDNINRATFGNENDQIPVTFNTGFSYNLIPNMSFNFGFEKDIDYNTSLKFGIDYNIIDNLSIRSGFSNEPSDYSAGIGINFPYFSINYAVFTHPDLGLTHQAGIIVTFDKVNNRYKKIRDYLNKN